MQIVRFLFYFLYARNWHSGQLELSRPRVVLFSAMLTLIILALLIASILQTPIDYSATTL